MKTKCANATYSRSQPICWFVPLPVSASPAGPFLNANSYR